MTTTMLFVALEPETREAILRSLRSDELTEILKYSATKEDAARKIAYNEQLCGQIELTLEYVTF